MTDIPIGISMDEKIYQQIIFQLLKNAIKYNHKDSAEGHLIIIDIAYFQLRDTEKPHRFSLVDIPQSNFCRLSCSKPLVNADEPVQDLGFLATRIIDHGDGMTRQTQDEALQFMRSSTRQFSQFSHNNVWSGLKVTSNLVEAQCCLLSINSEVEQGTDALFTIQTRSEETNIP